MRNNGCKAVLRCVQHLVHAALVYREAFAWRRDCWKGYLQGGGGQGLWEQRALPFTTLSGKLFILPAPNQPSVCLGG